MTGATVDRHTDRAMTSLRSLLSYMFEIRAMFSRSRAGQQAFVHLSAVQSNFSQHRHNVVTIAPMALSIASLSDLTCHQRMESATQLVVPANETNRMESQQKGRARTAGGRMMEK